MYIYSAKCLKVVDGDTIDARVDLGFDTFKKIVYLKSPIHLIQIQLNGKKGGIIIKWQERG